MGGYNKVRREESVSCEGTGSQLLRSSWFVPAFTTGRHRVASQSGLAALLLT